MKRSGEMVRVVKAELTSKFLKTLAKVAKEIGVELFVIDDDWFKGRLNDHGGLGDWTVDQTKSMFGNFIWLIC